MYSANRNIFLKESSFVFPDLIDSKIKALPVIVLFRGEDQYCKSSPREWKNIKLSCWSDI